MTEVESYYKTGVEGRGSRKIKGLTTFTSENPGKCNSPSMAAYSLKKVSR